MFLPAVFLSAVNKTPESAEAAWRSSAPLSAHLRHGPCLMRSACAAKHWWRRFIDQYEDSRRRRVPRGTAPGWLLPELGLPMGTDRGIPRRCRRLSGRRPAHAYKRILAFRSQSLADYERPFATPIAVMSVPFFVLNQLAISPTPLADLAGGTRHRRGRRGAGRRRALR